MRLAILVICGIIYNGYLSSAETESKYNDRVIVAIKNWTTNQIHLNPNNIICIPSMIF
jgi:hypothetical protein